MESLILAVTMACSLGTAAPAVAAQSSKISQTKDEYVEKARVELDELSLKIDALEVKAKAAGTSAKAGLDKRILGLKARRKTTKRDFVKLKRATGKAWVSFRAGVDNGLADLKRTYDDAAKD